MKSIFKLVVFLVCLAAIAYLGYSYLQKNEEQPQGNANIKVSEPKSNQEVTFPFKVTGEARVFENVLNVRLKDSKGTVLFEDFETANSPDMGIFGPFEENINYLLKEPESQDVILEVYWLSPKDGSEIDMVTIPLKLVLGDTTKLKVFFNNSNLDPEVSCNKVFPVERIVPKTQAPARLALEMLLSGPKYRDLADGYFSSINMDVRIQQLVVEERIARADFDDQLEFQVGGSCRVSAIRAQITETLKQFPTVDSVVISINGRTEDILQP